ncbi:MAG: hypothetical protein ACYYK0_00255 [Candidatus Eutrophobiaceae bacterium]
MNEVVASGVDSCRLNSLDSWDGGSAIAVLVANFGAIRDDELSGGIDFVDMGGYGQ